jgi:hypothetical protein
MKTRPTCNSMDTNMHLNGEEHAPEWIGTCNSMDVPTCTSMVTIHSGAGVGCSQFVFNLLGCFVGVLYRVTAGCSSAPPARGLEIAVSVFNTLKTNLKDFRP